ncbi:HypC/HybG/HupF family hydrogenase formation chaperone [Marinobacterium sp. D7]|uniref:HypC/HybG/HupF family hydrogenase formation chaperone n=1 Tax=Marinobacterium ramblicola TaxID=2849041 RepID=UPI001C2DDA58|nr:HypC/HybG/HupF family hydrogenase formation chaperone [Marinobacterium ramblicola]MBV1790136.1 HypC/HybG/HupF family hydrogenase formation chaperone [Marinobacterium ramblicola]
MCLAIPVRIEALIDEERALADIGGVRKEINTALVDDLAVGDYVIMHVGYALNKLDPEEAARTLALFEELGQLQAARDAIMAEEGLSSEGKA